MYNTILHIIHGYYCTYIDARLLVIICFKVLNKHNLADMFWHTKSMWYDPMFVVKLQPKLWI